MKETVRQYTLQDEPDLPEVTMKRIVFSLLYMFAISITPGIHAFGQTSDLSIKIKNHGRYPVPKSLLKVVSINLDNTPMEEALDLIAELGSVRFNYSQNRIPLAQKINLHLENVHALEALIKILEQTQTELLITSQGQLAIVPHDPADTRKTSITGQVLDQETKMALIGVNIMLVGSYSGAATDNQGHFKIANLPPGKHTLRFSYIGYKSEDVTIDTRENSSEFDMTVELLPQMIKLNDVIVTPGQFSIMGKGLTVQQTLTKENLETVAFGEDVYRAITRLPGISSTDFSAKFTVRGGENEEILVLMDGQQLYEPFHLKDIEGGALSIIDVEAIESIDLLTGGFSAEYGDRMSGVFNIKSQKPRNGRSQTSMGISFMNARVMSTGSFGNEGNWLFSARRGYLDLVLDLMGEENSPHPIYYDVLGKVEYRLNPLHTLSANVLYASDRLDFIEDDDDIDHTTYANANTWLTLRSVLSNDLFVRSVLSFGKLNHGRDGTAFGGDSNVIDFQVDDSRNVNLFGFKQDWNFDIVDRWILKWGFDAKKLTSDYKYLSIKNDLFWQNNVPTVIKTDSIRTNLRPSGEQFGAYISNRFRAMSPLTVELGLRYDHNSFTKDDLLSPRFNMVYELGKRTFLRGGWGYFYQTQGIHEIRVSDGENQFFRAKLAKHYVAGFEHYFKNQLSLRVEGYYKDLSDLQPVYRNWSRDIEIFPERLDDRYKLNLNGGTSKGLEVYLKYDTGAKVSWWLSYAFAKAEDNIRSLVADGIEYTASENIHPSRFDQRHTIYLDINYRPNRKWHLNVAWQYHSGWPYTEMVLKSFQQNDGSTGYYSSYEDYNGTRYNAFHRMDFRINRQFYTSKGRLSAYVSLINVYNHGNERNTVYYWNWVNNRPFLIFEKEYWFKLLPSIGVSWSWSH